MAIRFGIKMAVLLTTVLVSCATADVLPVELSTTGLFWRANGLRFAHDPYFIGLPGMAVDTDVRGDLVPIELGTIAFPNANGDFSGVFSLRVTSGSEELVFSAPFTVHADLRGHQDSLFIDFGTPAQFRFPGTDGRGDLRFQIRNVSLTQAGWSQDLEPRRLALTADYLGNEVLEIGAVVPETGSIVLLGTAFCGVMLARRRESNPLIKRNRE